MSVRQPFPMSFTAKPKKISKETVKRVQELLEQKQYIPSMAGILLAQNNSRIVGVAVHDHEKYEGRVLTDPFIASALNDLCVELEKAGYFLMVKVTREWKEISRFASMWNMEGMVIIGFCEQDYVSLRDNMRIPFIVYDGYLKEAKRLCNLVVDHYDGGRQMGMFFREMGHERVLCISDNDTCMDEERFLGFRDAMGEYGADFMLIPMEREERREFYRNRLQEIQSYSAVFAVSDYYAVDLMQFLQENAIRVPEDISVAGFDDSPLCRFIHPMLTTIKQDGHRRARLAVRLLQEMKEQRESGRNITLPVELVKRNSVKHIL